MKKIYNVGYNDLKRQNLPKIKEIQKIWNSMFFRCYKDNPIYKDCTVDEEWFTFSNFYNWCSNQMHRIENNFVLDKDLLHPSVKQYSKSTCCLVPREINSFLTLRSNDRGVCSIGVKKVGINFQARVNRFGKYKHLGTFPTEEEALNAYAIEKNNIAQELANKWETEIDSVVYEKLINFSVVDFLLERGDICEIYQKN